MNDIILMRWCRYRTTESNRAVAWGWVCILLPPPAVCLTPACTFALLCLELDPQCDPAASSAFAKRK